MLNKLFDAYLKVFLLGTMVFYVPGEFAYIPQEVFFQYGAIGFLFMSFFVPARRKIYNWRLGLLLFYVLLSVLAIHNTAAAKYSLMNVLLGSIIIKTVAERVDLDFSGLGKFFTAFCILNIMQLSLQVMNIDPIYTMVNLQNQTVIDHTGFLNSRFALASVAVLMLPFMYAASPVYIIAALPLLWFGKSSICIGAAALAILYLLWKEHRRAFWLLISAILIPAAVYIFFYDMPNGQFLKRFPVWLKGVEVLKLQPWFGTGLGNWATVGFVTVQENGQPETWVQAHNDILQWTFELGIGGMVLLWIWMRNLLESVRRHVPLIACLSLILVSFLHFPFHIARLAGIGCFVLAVMEAARADATN